jgi:hypothetical protein
MSSIFAFLYVAAETCYQAVTMQRKLRPKKSAGAKSGDGWRTGVVSYFSKNSRIRSECVVVVQHSGVTCTLYFCSEAAKDVTW